VRFANLDYLWLMPLVPALILFYWLVFALKRKRMERFANLSLLGQMLENASLGRQRFKAFLVVTSVLFMIFALMQPQWGYHKEEVRRKGVDIVLVVDTSKSMLAQDVRPNRLEAAKREIKDLLRELRGDRIALVGFSGTAFVQCPLTMDYSTFRLFLDNLRVGTIPRGGTMIGDAIRRAIAAFGKKRKDKHRVMILITDGEDHGSDPIGAAREAAKQGIRIYTVGVGRKSGDYIWIRNEKGEKVRLVDKQGNYVKSHLDEMLLNKIALETGGCYTPADAPKMGLVGIYRNYIAEMEKAELAKKWIKRYENRYQLPLLVAFILLCIEAITSERKRSR